MTSLDEAFMDTRGLSSRRGASFGHARASSRGQVLWQVRAATVALQLFADFGAILASAVMARALGALFLHLPKVVVDPIQLGHQAEIWAAVAGVVCGWFCITGHYAARRPLYEDTKRVTAALGVAFLLNAYTVFATSSHLMNAWVLMVWPLAMVAVPTARVFLRRTLDGFGWWRVGVLVMGSGEHGRNIEDLLQDDRYVGYVKTGHSFLLPGLRDADNTVAAKLKAEMERSCAKFVVVAPSEEEVRDFGLVADLLNQNLIPYYLVPPIQKLPLHGLSVRTMFSSDAVFLSYRSGLMSPTRQVTKRLFDIVGSAMLIAILAPFFLVLSAIIAADGGSPIFGHRRIGRDGKPFYCLKFRSMQKNADRILKDLLEKDPVIAHQWYTNFKLDPDPRITRLGRILRKTSLDELPQLFNVLKGEMSLVGPRPVVADELERYYGKDVCYYTMVRPGMTGLWQISGRSSTSYERRVFLDAWYVRNWSLWTDLVIFFNTVPSVLSRDGAV